MHRTYKMITQQKGVRASFLAHKIEDELIFTPSCCAPERRESVSQHLDLAASAAAACSKRVSVLQSPGSMAASFFRGRAARATIQTNGREESIPQRASGRAR